MTTVELHPLQGHAGTRAFVTTCIKELIGTYRSLQKHVYLHSDYFKKKMSKYTLTYFNLRGRAEVTRLIFAQAGVEYEDKRITNEQWAELKPTTPTGTVPLLEVDGEMFHGSRPFSRFVAERHGLAGTNDLENLQLAGIVDTIADLLLKLMPFFFEKDDTRKAQLLKDFAETHAPRYLGILEKMAGANNSAGDWLYGPKVTYADISLFVTNDIISKVVPNTLDKYPALTKLITSVENLPNIAKWLKERPVTDN